MCLLTPDFKLSRQYTKGKAFWRQIISDSICAIKRNIDIDILITSRSSGRDIMQSYE